MRKGISIPRLETPEKFVFCYICQAHASQDSRHCSKCDRCVEKFDHHCVWLNNCIGKKNYWYFFGAIFSCTLQLMFCVYTGIATIVIFHADWDSFKRETNRMYGTEALGVWIFFYAYTWVFIVVCFIASLATGQLVIFHLWLMKKGLTTLEYMLANKEEIFQPDKMSEK